MPVRDVRRRYIYAVVESEESIANLRVIEWDDGNQAAIVRVNHNRLNEMRAAMAHMSEIGGTEVRVDIKRVSGTIKALRSKIQ
jgi:RNase P/RNase MRP subunit POP5